MQMRLTHLLKPLLPPIHARKNLVMYEIFYQIISKANHPEEFLAGIVGYLHTDGYAGYHNLPEKITVVRCWAHARRYKVNFAEQKSGLAYCKKLFHIEKELADLSTEERQKQWLEQEKPVLDVLFA